MNINNYIFTFKGEMGSVAKQIHGKPITTKKMLLTFRKMIVR